MARVTNSKVFCHPAGPVVALIEDGRESERTRVMQISAHVIGEVGLCLRSGRHRAWRECPSRIANLRFITSRLDGERAPRQVQSMRNGSGQLSAGLAPWPTMALAKQRGHFTL